MNSSFNTALHQRLDEIYYTKNFNAGNINTIFAGDFAQLELVC